MYIRNGLIITVSALFLLCLGPYTHAQIVGNVLRVSGEGK